MYPRLLHIWGPVWIYSYGVMIAVGFLVFLVLTYRHPARKKLVAGDQYLNIVFIGLVAGIVGGRLLAVLTDWQEFSGLWWEVFYPWVGGFIVLGSILGVLITLPWYLKRRNVSIFPMLDLVALYTPLLQSIARIGCFLAGCCYGLPTAVPWGIMFYDVAGYAPLYTFLHPTQLYSCLASFLIFLVLQAMVRFIHVKPGQILFSYLILENFARYFVDFWRDDRGKLFDMAISENLVISRSYYQIFSVIPRFSK